MGSRALAVAVTALGLWAGTGEAADYAWPLDAPPALTSTYAEYRSGRFHAGLDVKTWGKEGYTCVAVADGYVWRVRTSPWGYGKAVYLRLEDGRTAVYAHLFGFVDAIEKIVAEEQDRRGAYSVNLYPPPDAIPVKRGDPVAYSGSTGSGYPHLHFEIRDRNQRPLNPLLNGFPVKDTTEPTILAVAFVPLDPDARVDGRGVPAVRTLRWVEGTGYVGEAVSVWGRIGVAVNVYDRADASALTNKLAPYRLTMSVDGKRLMRTSYDVFGYDKVYEVDLDRSFILNRFEGRKGFHNLYVARGNTLPLYDGQPAGTGVIAAGVKTKKPGRFFKPGGHQLTVQAEDAAKNRAKAVVDFSVRAPVSVRTASAKPAGNVRSIVGTLNRAPEKARSLIVEAADAPSGEWQWIKTVRVTEAAFNLTVAATTGPHYRLRLEDGTTAFCTVGEAEGDGGLAVDHVMFEGWSILTIRSPLPLTGPPSVSVEGTGPVDVHGLSPTVYEAVIANTAPAVVTVQADDLSGVARDTTLTLAAASVSPAGGTIASPDGGATAVFERSAVYRPLAGRVQPVKIPEDVESPVGRAYRFEPGTVPFREMVGVHFRVPDGVSREGLGVYELTDKGWAFVWNDVDSTRNTVWAGVRHFSVYALLRDDVPPEVTILSPADGSTVPAKPAIEVALADTMSGIPMEELIAFELDGDTMIFEYDPEGDVAYGLLRAPLTAGEHALTVRVRDTSGNETVATSRFTVAE